MASHFPRHSRSLVLEALADTRVVMVLGARQVGKSTLAEEIVDTAYPAQKIDLDERGPRDAALADPEGFIATLEGPALIDEFQHGGPDLLLAIKASVDRDKRPGRFLLTGSANILASRRAYDALTGRVEIIQLWPLAQSEIHGVRANVVDALFSGRPPRVSGAPRGRDAFSEAVAAGGYPEARERTPRRRARWFDSYIKTTVERDLREMTDAYKLSEVPLVLRAFASRAANLVSHRNVAERLTLDRKTVSSYARLLEMVFLIREVPAWRPGFTAREGKTPKVYLADTGLLLHLLDADEKRLRTDDQVTGKAVENFVAMEIVKHLEWAETRAGLFHYRGRNREEIDLILESHSGEIVAIEAKAAVSLSRGDWAELARLRDRRPEKFIAGVIFHSGEQTLPLGDRLWAVPFSGLWA